ncbi:SAM-dependent chlorinase/fluorinase [Nodosilinea sp. LEGE 06152]|uniref:SAM hydrolase/SAM-dependent halogenase family protein n=1 Tax=Nodosilinea sp. LEGE 06152 TaxID=2777966 RepID=UPI00187F1750|nr:SAM-dependent chlorinase/fluorinase [Nodosilinea sp. LEGE 06152]MBE9159838.1 SAM-dependent chlorinase/fluorinase [Nodosilinea sp. LEGE 06152]
MLIALITDFGTQDSYVGVMKGVIAGICPTAQTINITHDLPPQDLYAARFTLLSAYPYMPPGTVYLVVVDPGVGTQRRAVAVQTSQGYLVGPDNGVLGGIVEGTPILNAVELANAEYWRVPQPSTTFHGRDIFAPAAAHLANGVPIERLGPAIDPQSLKTLPLPAPVGTATGWEGVVQYIDRFGNAATTISGSAVESDNWTLTLGETTLLSGKTYGEVPPGEGLALVGSHGFVEIAVNQGSAKERFGLAVGDCISITHSPTRAKNNSH